MKLRVPAAILGACMLLSANGCSFLELGLDDALRPPKTMGDEAEIEKLIPLFDFNEEDTGVCVVGGMEAIEQCGDKIKSVLKL